MRRSRALVLLALAVALGSCEPRQDEPELAGAGDQSDPTRDATATPTKDVRVYTTSGAVLEDATHGPQLCFGGMPATPPQCEGTAITNWDWDAVTDEETRQNTTWGFYTLIGTYDGRTFTLTEAPGAPTRSSYPRTDLTSPCAPPEGGWVVPEPERATGPALRAAGKYTESHPDGAGWWLDQSTEPAYPDSATALDRKRPEDHVSRLVLNFRFAGDLERHQTELRDRWGGAMCVLPVRWSEAELEQILQDLMADPNSIYGSVEISTNDIYLQVMVDDGLQDRLDKEYGEGTVRVAPYLRPVEP